MSFIELFLLAVGLSMDAFAVSVCKGLAMKKADLKSMAVCGIWFGGFQALMPLAGFASGISVCRYHRSGGSLDRLCSVGIDRSEYVEGSFRKKGRG